MNVIEKQISSLLPYARNAKLHNDTQIVKIAESIQAFGFTNPVLIDRENNIIAGHGRVLAAEKLAMSAVPCIILDHLNGDQVKAYRLADNRLQELGGGWDEAMVKELLIEIHQDGTLEVELTGFDLDQGEVKLKPVSVRPPPSLAWVLIKIPLEKFGEVQPLLDQLPGDSETFTTYTDENRQP